MIRFLSVLVQTAQTTWERVQWYSYRGGYEAFHRSLKTGCGIQRRRLCCRGGKGAPSRYPSPVVVRLASTARPGAQGT